MSHLSVQGNPFTAAEVIVLQGLAAGGSSSPVWGGITGTLSDQTDLQTALNNKQGLDTQLTDLAGLSYTGNALKYIRVNAGENGVELATVAGGTIDGSGTLNELTYWVDSDTIGALAVATYPSLTEISYVKGVTSAIQTQLNAKMANPMTTGGDVIYGGASGAPTRLANGSAGQVLTSAGTTLAPTWTTISGLSWGSSINGASGTGVALALDNSYAASGIGQSITIGNTQTQALIGLKIDSGTSTGLKHIPLNISYRKSIGAGSTTAIDSAAIAIDMGTSGNYGDGIALTITPDNSSNQSLVKLNIGDGNWSGTAIRSLYTGTTVIASGSFIDAQYSSTRSAMNARTTTFANFANSRIDTRTSGTTADNYNLMKLYRFQQQNGAGGTFTSTGSVLYAENDCTQTAGTLTDTTDVIKVIQDSLSTGLPISITQAAVVSTNYRRVIKETSTAISLWWGDSTTANGTLSGTAGDVIFNAGSNLPEVCTGTTNWAGLVTTSGTQTLTNKTLTSPTLTTPSPFTTGGTITLAENTSIALDPAGSADGKYSGITVAGTAGYAQAFGDLVYLDPTDSRWEAVDANAASGADGDARGVIGMVVSAGTDGTSCTILLQGIIRADANFPALTINAPVYAAETAGDIVVTQPVTADVVIRVVGFALTADEIYFNPSPDYITHT